MKGDKQKKEGLIIGAIALAMGLAEWLLGAFPIDLFRFPVNLLTAILWLATLCDLYRRRHTSELAQFLLSPRATHLSLLLLVVVGGVIGLQRQATPTAWPVLAVLLFLLSHLWMVILRGWRTAKGIRIRFLLLHLGLWIALFSAFWGAPDRTVARVMVSRDEPTQVAYNSYGRATHLDFEMQLREFDVQYYENQTPSAFNATIELDGKPIELRVNHPYDRSLGESIYLIHYDQAERDDCRYCIVEVVREPWRPITFVGILLLAMGAIGMFARGAKNFDKPHTKLTEPCK